MKSLKRKIWASSALVAFGLAILCLLAWAPKRRATSVPAPPLSEAPAAARVTEDEDDASIAGFVRRRNGEGVKNALACATTVSSEVFWTPSVTCAATDRAGAYRIRPLPSTAYVVSAAADGFLPGSALLGGSIFLRRGEAKTGVDMTLQSGGARLSGRVLGATGGPISGARLRVLRQALPHQTLATATGPYGRFSLSITPGPVTVLAEADGYAPVRVAHVAPSSDLVLTLTPGSTISGKVIAESSGQPVSSVRVRALRPGSFDNPLQPAGMSDAQGSFEIHGLEPGNYTLVAAGSGWRGDLLAPIAVGLAARVDRVSLTVSAASVVTGKVVQLGGGEPCSRGSVILGPVDAAPPERGPAPSGPPKVPTVVATLEGDGAVRFPAVPSGVYRVDVQCTDSLLHEGPTRLEVRRSNIDRLLWKVASGVRLTVHAVDESEKPVANVHLLLSAEAAKEDDPAQPPLRKALVTDTEGRCEMGGLPPGVYRLEPERGYQGQPVEVDARGLDKVAATMRLAGRGSILVTVQTPEGAGVDQVEVFASLAEDTAPQPNPQPTAASKLDAQAPVRPAFAAIRRATGLGNGRFEIGPLAEGSYRVRVSDGINPPAEPHDWPHGTVRVGAGAAQATVVLQRDGNITGRVADSSGQALPDYWVSANCAEAEGGNDARRLRRGHSRPPLSRRVMSDRVGQFRIDGLAPDAMCTVRAERPGAQPVGIARNVRPGEQAIVTVAALGTLNGTATLQPLRAQSAFFEQWTPSTQSNGGIQ